jgi:hypothetical protein
MAIIMNTICFNQWVNDNNIDRKHPYSKGWWDFVDLIRLLAHHLGSDVQSVVGELHFTTPPPQTPMSLPVVHMEFGDQSATIAWFLSFTGFAPEYLVSFSGQCKGESNGYRTFTASPNEFQWTLEKLPENPLNQPLLPYFSMSAGNCVFATNTEMDLYAALKCLTTQ